VSHFIYNYAECYYAECHYADCHYAEGHNAEGHNAEFHHCFYAEFHQGECHYVSVISLNVFMVSVIIMYVIMMSVVAPLKMHQVWDCGWQLLQKLTTFITVLCLVCFLAFCKCIIKCANIFTAIIYKCL
jgi:hypothetical protein